MKSMIKFLLKTKIPSVHVMRQCPSKKKYRLRKMIYLFITAYKPLVLQKKNPLQASLFTKNINTKIIHSNTKTRFY